MKIFTFNPYPYYQVNYRTFNGNSPYTEESANNLISTKGDQVVVQPMWRMELLGKYYGICIHEYEDNTNWEYYEERRCNGNILSKEELEEIDRELYEPDRFDDYFERLAEVAAEVGCERAEIKCLIKSLMMRYRMNKINSINDFPHEAFNKLYNRLVSSKDLEQLRVAERLGRYHISQLKMFFRYDIKDKTMQANRVEKE